MSTFTANRGAFTPVANATQADNWVLSSITVGITARVKMITCGGRGTTAVGYRTRWGRVNNTPVTPAALTLASSNPNATALSSVNTYTTQATLAADPTALYSLDWLVNGGGVVLNLPIGGEWMTVGGALGTLFNQIACGNIAGADASLSSYTVAFEE
jgi:hypothetical protein